MIYEDETDHDYDLANRLSSLVGNARVSFINKDGTVFVDTYIDGEPDDNHSTREEIKQAELEEAGSRKILKDAWQKSDLCRYEG